MRLSYKSIALATTLAFAIVGCSNLKQYQNLPTVTFGKVTSNFTDRQNPVINADYCLVNQLNTTVDINKIVFNLYVNSVYIVKQTVNFNHSIDEQSQRCFKVSFTPNVQASPKVASVLTDSFFAKPYMIEAFVHYDDDEIAPNKSTATGSLQP